MTAVEVRTSRDDATRDDGTRAVARHRDERARARRARGARGDPQAILSVSLSSSLPLCFSLFLSLFLSTGRCDDGTHDDATPCRFERVCARRVQAILYLTSVGEPSGVYETVKVGRVARALP